MADVGDPFETRAAMSGLVFISYSTQASADLAHFVDATLRERGCKTFLDVSTGEGGPIRTTHRESRRRLPRVRSYL
jgi:hypothetical protein